MRRSIWSLAMAVAACNQGSSPVTVNGHLLDPKDGVFWSGKVNGSPVTRVVIADQRSLCDRFDKLDPCTSAGQAETPGDGTFLNLDLSDQVLGEYTVGSSDRSRAADFVFTVREGGVLTWSARAASGTVSLTNITPGEGGAGSYSVKLPNGKEVDGTFTGGYCSRIDAFFQRASQAALTCATNSSATDCTQLCSCSLRTVGADCARPDAGSDWSCTCTRDDARTTCTVPATDVNVCIQGNSCCDVDF